MSNLKPCPFCGSEDLDPARPAKRYIECNWCHAFSGNPDEDGIGRQWDITLCMINDHWNGAPRRRDEEVNILVECHHEQEEAQK